MLIYCIAVCTNNTAPSVSSINRILRNRAAERAAAEFARNYQLAAAATAVHYQHQNKNVTSIASNTNDSSRFPSEPGKIGPFVVPPNNSLYAYWLAAFNTVRNNQNSLAMMNNVPQVSTAFNNRLSTNPTKIESDSQSKKNENTFDTRSSLSDSRPIDSPRIDSDEKSRKKFSANVDDCGDEDRIEIEKGKLYKNFL